jgi:hypothetical protein
VHSVSDVSQTEIHTAEPLVPDPSPLEAEIAIGKLKTYKSPGSFWQNTFKQEVKHYGSEIHKLINSLCNKEELPYQWKESIIVPVYKKG